MGEKPQPWRPENRIACPRAYTEAVTRLVLLSLLASLPLWPQTPGAAPRGQWISLFNGKDLAGWTPKITGYPAGENFANTFRVVDGLLTVSYDGYDKFQGPNGRERFGHLFYKTPYSNYIVAAEYRFIGEQAAGGPGWATRNSGIMVHGQMPGDMGLNQDFPISIEVQLLGGNGTAPRTTANLCTPGTNVVIGGQLVTRHCTSSTSPTFHGDQWVRVEAEVHGAGTIIHRVNGVEVLRYEKAQTGGGNVKDTGPNAPADGMLLTGGTISLQSESHPVQFRKVELLVLPAE